MAVTEGESRASVEDIVVAEKTDVSARSTSPVGLENPETSQPANINHDDPENVLPESTITDDNIVWWDGDDDSQNPYNWSTTRKVINCAVISILNIITPLASSMIAPGVPELMREFESGSTYLGAFVVSVFVLGFAAGPMIFAPMSEIYGRRIIYNMSNVVFIVFVVACAVAPSLHSLIIFRFLSGVFGSPPITNGGGTVTDMIVQEKRGTAVAVLSIGPLLGPIIGPVVGGLVAENLGWRWTFWVLAMVAGALTIATFLFSHETYAPVLLERKAAKMREETGNTALRSKLQPDLSPTEYFVRAIKRPFKMLLTSPICICCGAYVALSYSYLYLLFSTITPVFTQIYQFSVTYAGLAFLGLGVGALAGLAYFTRTSDSYIRKKSAEEEAAAEAEGRPKQPVKPEYRLPPLRVGALVLPIGFFIYGWTADYQVHWIAPIIGTCLIAVGNIIIFISLQMYLVDTFTLYSASALASNAVVRSIAGGLLPLAAIPMYDTLGMGWGNSLLGFVALVMVPLPWLFLRYGEYLRTRYEIKNI